MADPTTASHPAHVAEGLRLLAAARRDYAHRGEGRYDDELLAEATAFDAAADLVEGQRDLVDVAGAWAPAWWWPTFDTLKEAPATVTLTEASTDHGQGLVPLTRDALRRARARADFPHPTVAVDGEGRTARRYRTGDLLAWYRNQTRANPDTAAARPARTASDTKPANTVDRHRLGFDYAWGWFALHSEQRMHMVNFWLVVVGLVSAGLASALIRGSTGPAGLLAAAGVLVTAAFHRLDRRTRALIEPAERALVAYEDDLAAALRHDDLRLVAAAERSKTPRGSYRFVLSGLQACATVTFGAIAAACAAQMLVTALHIGSAG